MPGNDKQGAAHACPFCGNFPKEFSYGKYSYVISCDCEAQPHVEVKDDKNCMEKALAIWNGRPPSWESFILEDQLLESSIAKNEPMACNSIYDNHKAFRGKECAMKEVIMHILSLRRIRAQNIIAIGRWKNEKN